MSNVFTDEKICMDKIEQSSNKFYTKEILAGLIERSPLLLDYLASAEEINENMIHYALGYLEAIGRKPSQLQRIKTILLRRIFRVDAETTNPLETLLTTADDHIQNKLSNSVFLVTTLKVINQTLIGLETQHPSVVKYFYSAGTNAKRNPELEILNVNSERLALEDLIMRINNKVS